MPRKGRLVFALLGVAAVSLFIVAVSMELFGTGKVFKGVKIDGTPVGGMTKAQVLKISRDMTASLNRDITLRYADKTFKLDAKSIDFKARPDAMAAMAYIKGRDEFLPVRMFKRLFGIPKTVDIPVLFSDNGSALKARIAEIAKAVDHQPTSARISVASGSPVIVPSDHGVKVDVDATARAVCQALPGKEHAVEMVVSYIRPELTELNIGKIVVIHIKEFRLYLYDRDKYLNDYQVAVGMKEYPTPTGRFYITYKEKNPTWLPTSEWAKDKKGIPQPPGPDNPLGGYWMDLGGGIGIHATPFVKSLGEQASHGCIRMAPSDAEALFNAVKVGTPVIIID